MRTFVYELTRFRTMIFVGGVPAQSLLLEVNQAGTAGALAGCVHHSENKAYVHSAGAACRTPLAICTEIFTCPVRCRDPGGWFPVRL